MLVVIWVVVKVLWTSEGNSLLLLLLSSSQEPDAGGRKQSEQRKGYVGKVAEKREILGGWISIYSSYFQWSENDRLTRVQFLSNEYLFNANFVVGRDHQRSCICLQWKMLNTNSLWDSPFTWPSAVECNRPRTVLIDSPKIMDSRAVTLTKISPKHFGKFCNKRMQTKQD